MYNRATTQQIKDWHKEFGADRLFQNLYSALSAICRQVNDITPEEIWELANQHVREIVQTENDLFEIDALPHNLFFLLSTYMNEGAKEPCQRTQEDTKRIVFLVQFVILYQLTRYQTDWENHPYKKYCIALVEQLRSNPLMEQLIPLVKETNDRYETIYGGEVEPYDYLPFVNKGDDQAPTQPTEEVQTDTDKNRHIKLFVAAMKKMQVGIYCEKPLESNIKCTYEWYAIYRLAKEIGLIANFDDFLQLMKGDDWKCKPTKIQNFQLHQSAISEDTTFPNWICPSSYNNKFFNKFLHIAKVTYVLYEQSCKKTKLTPFG